MTKRTDKISRMLGFVAVIISRLFAKSAPDKPGKGEFKTSTQRLGIRFTDKIRNIYRHRWIKKAGMSNTEQTVSNNPAKNIKIKDNS